MIRSWRRDCTLPAPSFRLDRFRPGIENLEDRSLPAVFNPLAAPPDGDLGSLRAAIIAANGNGQDDTFNLEIIVAANGKPIRIFDEAGQRLASFRPFGTAYKGAVRVAAGDVNGGGLDEIVFTRGGPVRVRIFNSAGAQVLPEISPVTAGHPFLAVGDIDQDQRADIILGDGAGSDFRVLDSSGSEILFVADPYGTDYTGGVRVAAVDADYDGEVEIVIAPGKNAGVQAKYFQGDGSPFGSFDVFASGATGFFVAGSV